MLIKPMCRLCSSSTTTTSVSASAGPVPSGRRSSPTTKKLRVFASGGVRVGLTVIGGGALFSESGGPEDGWLGGSLIGAAAWDSRLFEELGKLVGALR